MIRCFLYPLSDDKIDYCTGQQKNEETPIPPAVENTARNDDKKVLNIYIFPKYRPIENKNYGTENEKL